MTLKARISDDGDRIILDSQFHHLDRIKDLMGSKFDKVTETWSVPLTWSSCVALRRDFGVEFEPEDEINAWGYAEVARRLGPARALRGALDPEGITFDDARASALWDAVHAFSDDNGLHPYQTVGAGFVAITAPCMLFDEQGTGKTVQTIAALAALQEAGEQPFPVLVVAPASVKSVWAKEIQRWYPGLTVTNVKGSAVQRRKALSEPAHIYVITYNLMPKHARLAHSPGAPAIRRCPDCGGLDPAITEDKCQAHVRELNRVGFRTVVLDEAHRATNPKSAWTRAIWSVSDDATYRIALTGTPTQETIEPLWALLRFIRPQEFAGKKTDFLARYAHQSYNAWGVPETTGLNPARADELHQLIDPLYRRVLKDVVLPFLPPIVEERRTVEMTGAQAKAYRDLKKQMVTELEAGTLVALKAGIRTGRLMQLASSYLEVLDPAEDDPSKLTEYTDDEAMPSVRACLPSNKISAFVEDIKAGDYDQTDAGVVVFAQSRQLLELLSAELKRAEIEHGTVTGADSEADRARAVDDFQAGRIKYILVSIAAGGAGLTLTAADTAVFLQRSWSSVDMSQAYARTHRLGSEIHESIRIIHYLTEGTIEEHQLNTLERKDVSIQQILRDEQALLEWLKEGHE